MKYRNPISRRKSRRQFTRGAIRVNRRNYLMSQRGGIRM